jgi:hypothetical protein
LGAASAAGLPLARLLLRSTSRPRQAPTWWLVPGEPLIVFQADISEIPSPPAHTRAVKTGEPGLQLSWHRVLWNRRALGVWYIRSDPTADLDAVRRLRIHLLRLHAQREALKHVLRHIALGLIAPQRSSDESEALQSYLSDASGWLLTPSHYGHPQAAMLTTAYGADALVAEGLRASLLHQLRGIRRTILSKVAIVTEPNANSTETIFIIDQRITMTDQSINIGGISGGTIGAIGQHATVIDSLNTIQSSKAPDEMKEALATLVKEVTQLAERLPTDQTDQVLEDTNAIVREATKPRPRASVISTFGGHVLDTARTVADFASPIGTIIKTILTLL